jgi:hypothetical protein
MRGKTEEVLMIRCILYSCIAMLCLPPGVRADKETASPRPAPAVVPFEILRTKHMAVQIKVNGKGPYRVIFDTGAPITLLNNKIAKEAELKGEMPGAPKGASGGLGGFALFGMRGGTKVKLLELGDLKAADTPVMIMDHPALSAVSRVLGPVDGIVGFPFFAKYQVDLDYQKMTMTFVPTGFEPPDVMQAMMQIMLDTKTKPKRVFAAQAVLGFSVAKQQDDEESGVEITQVVAGSPAATAGVQVGDRLLVLDAHWTDCVQDCYRAATGIQPGDTVLAKLKRGDKELTVSLKPAAGL